VTTEPLQFNKTSEIVLFHHNYVCWGKKSLSLGMINCVTVHSALVWYMRL